MRQRKKGCATLGGTQVHKLPQRHAAVTGRLSVFYPTTTAVSGFDRPAAELTDTPKLPD